MGLTIEVIRQCWFRSH